MSDGPIGIFDSGVGGLSVAREIHARLPREDLLYFADTAYCPYGVRPMEEIRERSLQVVGELVGRGAKVVVVACNTASGAALEALRGTFSVPIVGLEPAVKPAAARSRRGRIGVLATTVTLKTERFQRLIRDYAGGVEVLPQPCPGLADLVETGDVHGEAVREKLRDLLAPLRDAEVDTVVLGCTHYPFVRDAIEEALGGGVEILDSGEAVARQVERVLRERDALSLGGDGGLRLLTSGDPDRVAEVAGRLWGDEVAVYSVGQKRSSGAPPAVGSTR